MSFFKKIKSKSINEIFQILLSKIDRKLTFPMYGFTRNHVNNFMENNLIKILPNQNILDVGAGNQPYKKYFINCNYETCESSDVLSEIGYNGELDHTFYCDITKSIPRNENYYDIVICNEVFEHINEPLNALKEIHRVLKKNGKLILTVPQCHGLHQEPHNYFNYLYYGLEYLFKKANFSYHSIYPLGGIYHLLGKILQNSTNLLFSKMNISLRIIVYPFELFLKLILFIICFFLFYFDRVDKEKKWTINYGCTAIK